MKDSIARAQARVEALEREAGEIGDDQNRLRENIKSLKDTADAKQLIARYIAKADPQETRLEQLNAEKKAAQAEAARLQTELETAFRSLKWEQKL